LIRRLLTASFAVFVLGAVPAAAAPATEAVWAWSWRDADTLVGEVTEHGFDRVYLYAEGGLDAKVREAVAALTARGIAVEALGGEQRWATTQRGGLLAFVRSAVRYQRAAPPGARLAGIHLDVEPYGLPAWGRDQGRVARSLIASLRAARRAAGGLPLAADLPYWFDGIRHGRRSLAEAAIAATDATTIMAYRDSSDGIVAAARREVAIAGELGRRTTIGVETGAVRPRSVTFHEEGAAALARALTAVRARFAGHRGFGGTAVHHLGSVVRLRP
jgi:hypothetical protein